MLVNLLERYGMREKIVYLDISKLLRCISKNLVANIYKSYTYAGLQ